MKKREREGLQRSIHLLKYRCPWVWSFPQQAEDSVVTLAPARCVLAAKPLLRASLAWFHSNPKTLVRCICHCLFIREGNCSGSRKVKRRRWVRQKGHLFRSCALQAKQLFFKRCQSTIHTSMFKSNGIWVERQVVWKYQGKAHSSHHGNQNYVLINSTLKNSTSKTQNLYWEAKRENARMEWHAHL